MRASATPVSRAAAYLRSADPVLARIVEQVGPFRMAYMPPEFGSLVRSIVFQQLSGKVARVIFDRFTAEAGLPLRPARVLRLTDEQMRAIGLSKQKAAYIRDLAEKAPRIRFKRLPDLPDADVIETLTAVKGIGVWTAHMFLMFALRRPDVLPTGDLGIQSAIQRAYGLAELPKPKEVERIGEPWQPFRSVASWYLWRSLEVQPPDGTAKGL